MKKRVKTIKIGNMECLVETLMEWVNGRIAQIRRSERMAGHIGDNSCDVNNARLGELLIIREKVNDGRIQKLK